MSHRTVQWVLRLLAVLLVGAAVVTWMGLPPAPPPGLIP